MRDGAEAGFKYFRITGETCINVVTRGTGGVFAVLDENGKELAKIPLTTRQDWGESVAVKLAAEPGVHALYFRYEGDGTLDFRAFTLKKGAEEE